MDIFFRGIIAGFIAGLVKDIPDAILRFVFHLKRLVYWDYAGVMGFNKIPHTFLEHLLAFGFEVMFSTGLGIVFTFLAAKVIKTKHYILLGSVFGGSVWFFVTTGVKIFKITELQTNNLIDPTITFLLSVAYGLLLMVIDHWLQKRNMEG